MLQPCGPASRVGARGDVYVRVVDRWWRKVARVAFLFAVAGLGVQAWPSLADAQGTRVPLPGHVHRLQLLPAAQLRLDGKAVVLSQLASMLERDARVVVQPQAGVPLQEMISVIDQLKAAGVSLTLGQAAP